MKIMKLLAACAMVGALATSSAMAEEFLGEYDATSNSIAINLDAADIKDYVDVNNITGDLTVLVTNVATGTVSNTQIFQIDQGTRTALDNDGNDGTSTCVLKLSAAVKADYDAIMNPNAGTETVAEGEESTKPASSTYYVRLGGAEKGYIEDTFVFTAPKQEEPEDPKPETIGRYVGDFIPDEDINPDDANAIMKYNAGMAVYEDGSEPEYVDLFASAYAADESINPIDDLSGDDANAIMWWVAGNSDADKAGNVAGYGEFYYDEENDMYLLYGDLIFE